MLVQWNNISDILDRLQNIIIDPLTYKKYTIAYIPMMVFIEKMEFAASGSARKM